MKYYIIASIIIVLLSGGVAWWFFNKCGAGKELINGECVAKCLHEQVRDSDGKCNWIPCEQVAGAGEGWSRNVDNICVATDTPIPDEPVKVKLDDLNFRTYGPVGDGCDITTHCSKPHSVDYNLSLEPEVINSRHVIFTDSQGGLNGNYKDYSSKTIVFDAGEYNGNPRSWELTIKQFMMEKCCDRLALEVSNDGIMWTNAQIPQLTTVDKYDERKYKWFAVSDARNSIQPVDDTPGYMFSSTVVKDTPFQTNNRFLRFSFFSDHSKNDLGWEMLLKAHPILATN